MTRYHIRSLPTQFQFMQLITNINKEITQRKYYYEGYGLLDCNAV
jgi:hypothetical protein